MIGSVVLVIGLVAAGLTYWTETRYAGPTIEELLPGSLQARRRQMGILYGPIGPMAVDFSEALKRPDTHALLIIIAGVLVAAFCFHLARLPDDEH